MEESDQERKKRLLSEGRVESDTTKINPKTIGIGCGALVALVFGVGLLNNFLDYLDPERAERREEEMAQREVDRAAEAAIREDAEANQERYDQERRIAAALSVTSLELAQAYEANEVGAQQRFGDRPLLVTGTVTGITLDFLDNPVVQLNAVNEFLPVQADLDDKNAAAQLVKGQQVRLLCQEVTEVISAPMLSECEIAD